MAFRVSSSNRTNNTGILAQTEYIIAPTWARSGGNVTIKTGVNGLYSSPVVTPWVNPPAGGLWLGGINASNDQADILYHDILVFDKVLSDAELLDAYNNFDSFYI